MFKKIMSDIKSNLTGDVKKDRLYIIIQMNKYKDHEYSEEITRELSSMLFECLSDDKKQKYKKQAEEENPVKLAFEKAHDYVVNNDLKEALKHLDSFFSSYTFFYQDDKVYEFHSFENPIEEMIFLHYFESDKDIRLIPLYMHYVDIHQLYANLLMEFERFDEAKDILDYVIKLNPVLSSALLNRSELFKLNDDWDSFYKVSCDALKYAYSSFDIARAYRNLGYYFIEMKDFELAVALFNFSLSLDYSPIALSELEYIKSLGYKNSISENRIFELLKENNIQIGPNPFVLNVISQLIMDERLNDHLNNVLFLYTVFYDLTKDEEFLEKINQLKRKLG